MELALAFWPSLALGMAAVLFNESRKMWRDGCEHGDRMYELGKRHGREEASLEAYELSLRLRGLLADGDEDDGE